MMLCFYDAVCPAGWKPGEMAVSMMMMCMLMHNVEWYCMWVAKYLLQTLFKMSPESSICLYAQDGTSTQLSTYIFVLLILAL